MKYFLAALTLVATASTALAQNDSITVVNTKWKTQRVAPGVTLKTASFNKNLFTSNQQISILEVRRPKRNEIRIGFEPQTLIKTSEFGARENAIAAINGTFFDIKNGGSVDFLKAAGKVVSKNRLNKDGSRAIHQKAAVLIDRGQASIEEWNGRDDWEQTLPAEEVMLTGPLLLKDGNPVALDSTLFVKARHPRSAVATRKNKVYFITIDGRQENAAGMSLTELRRFAGWMKFSAAINLDGGGSTTLWVQNMPDGGVVNYPSDNKKWDHQGERKVANVLLVKKRSRR